MNISKIKWINDSNTELEYVDEYGVVNFVSLPTEAQPQKSICENIIAGVYGDIEAYVHPTPLSKEELDALMASKNRDLRDSKLISQVDPLVSNPLRWADLSQENKDAVAIYRRALLDITTHVNWPNLKPEDWPTLTLV